MSKKAFFAAVGIALLFAGAYAYFLNKTKERPEPNEEGGEAPDYPIEDETYPSEQNSGGALEVRNFKVSEFSCHDKDHNTVTPVPDQYLGNVAELMHNLQVLRDYLGVPISVNSGYRTPYWNTKQKGKKNSFHLRAMAGDIHVWGKSPAEVKAAIELLISQGKMKQGGIGLYPTFVHYDVRGSYARW